MIMELFTPLRIGSVTLKNRIVMAPTSMGLSVEEKAAFLGRIADAGTALIYLGDVGVEPTPYPTDCSLFTESGRQNYKTIIDRIHRGGALVGAQLYLWDFDMEELFVRIRRGASRAEIDDFKNNHVSEYITGLSLQRMEEIVAHFAEAARISKELGADVIQILGGHILNSASSGYYNRRQDVFGTDTRGRIELSVRVVRAVRAAVGDLPIEYKLPIHDDRIPCGLGGPDFSELKTVVTALEEAGVDAFQAALSNRDNIQDTVPKKNHPHFQEEGCFLFVSDEIKKYTSLPVSCAGKFQSPGFLEACVASGRLDYVGMSRQLVADPQWVEKVSLGQEDAIRKCIFCNRGCLDSLLRREPFHCVLDGK